MSRCISQLVERGNVLCLAKVACMESRGPMGKMVQEQIVNRRGYAGLRRSQNYRSWDAADSQHHVTTISRTATGRALGRVVAIDAELMG